MKSDDKESLRSVRYWSRTICDADRNYDTTELECLAIVWTVPFLQPYLQDERFFIQTDHAVLRCVLNLTAATDRLARWRLRLLKYALEVIPRPGIVHEAPDSLFLLSTTGFDTTLLEDEIRTSFVRPAEWFPHIKLSDEENDSSTDKMLRSGSPAFFVVVNATYDSPIQTDIFLQSQAADPD